MNLLSLLIGLVVGMLLSTGYFAWRLKSDCGVSAVDALRLLFGYPLKGDRPQTLGGGGGPSEPL